MSWAFVSTIVATLLCDVLHSAVVAAQADECKFIEATSDKCRSAGYITVAEQRVQKGQMGVRVTLPGMQSEVRWYCGGSQERTAWGIGANQLRINYQSDGTIQWRVYRCADLSGPIKAGLRCAVPHTTEFCPKFLGANNSACVFELTKSTSHVDEKTTTVSVEGSLRADVEKEAGPLNVKGSAEVKGGVSHSVTKAKILTFKSRHFLVIPPGFSFCAFTNNTSVPDVHAPTGFRWRCSFPEYIQSEERFSSGRCTGLEICEEGVCGQGAANGIKSVHLVSSFLILVWIAVFLASY